MAKALMGSDVGMDVYYCNISAAIDMSLNMYLHNLGTGVQYVQSQPRDHDLVICISLLERLIRSHCTKPHAVQTP
jgi:hypothetical protein